MHVFCFGNCNNFTFFLQVIMKLQSIAVKPLTQFFILIEIIRCGKWTLFLLQSNLDILNLVVFQDLFEFSEKFGFLTVILLRVKFTYFQNSLKISTEFRYLSIKNSEVRLFSVLFLSFMNVSWRCVKRLKNKWKPTYAIHIFLHRIITRIICYFYKAQ